MPTSNPRINVTLPPSLDAVIGRLATLERVSKAHVVRELLEASEPILARSVALMDAAAKARVESRTELRRSLERSLSVMEGELEKNLATLAVHARDLVGTAEVVAERRPAKRRPRVPAAGRQGAKTPLPSKRGVKS